MIPIMQPYVPKYTKNKYLKKIDKEKFYTNFGPLSLRLKTNLKKHFNTFQEVELFSSATAALVSILKTFDDNKEYILLPSWTFVATAQAVIAAGFKPYFVDIDKDTQTVSVSSLKSVPRNIVLNSAALVVVSPFGKPVDFKKYFDFTKKNQLKIIYDCAAGFDAFKTSPNIISILSLHATKILPAGEGGILFCINKRILAKARSYSNYGFLSQRKSIFLGINLKISEYHCSNALSSLDQWHQIRKMHLKKASYYRKLLSNNSFSFLNGWGETWISTTCVLITKNKSKKKKLMELFVKNKIEFRDWWSSGCHKEPIFKKYKKTNLINTNDISTRTIGIPFSANLKVDEQKKIINIINSS